ncbi:S-adenosyl-L-methionine-dependent methyltransferase [Crassisporium funariophilum]|nr:S-adenosyl-L-methionine-dependent methyltransferase [Crassisporium funariophilum]
MFSPSQAHGGDAPIRGTDNDAAAARLSAIQKQYLVDPFLKYLVPRAHLLPPRPPLINVGTYVRSSSIDALVDQWLQLSASTGQRCQIVSLGAGSDTRFWRIAASALKDNLQTYVELDFPEITTKKGMAIRKHKELMSSLGNPDQVTLSQGGTALHSPKYHLLPADLRLPPSETLEKMLFSAVDEGGAPILDTSLPTLLLFECVLAYMSPSSSSRLLQWFVDTIQESADGILGCVVYEMFGLNDSFGRVMVNNLKERNISIPGVEPFSDEKSLAQRFLQTGFTAAHALTLKEIRRAYIDPAELERLSKLEFLDEMEELDLVLAHYAISWGLFIGDPDSRENWGSWGLTKKEIHDTD